MRWGICAAAVAAFCALSCAAIAQDQDQDQDQDQNQNRDQNILTPPAVPEPQAPPEPAPEPYVGGPVQGFQTLPTIKNTYVVTYDLRGIPCVQGVGTPTRCAVTYQSADEGGYPWTKVKCRTGDRSVSTFAWSLDSNSAMAIFEAPPAMITGAKTYAMNVRLGRVCLNPVAAAGGK
ncbi:MAG: hypothetical protein WC956_03225 [bacterium]